MSRDIFVVVFLAVAMIPGFLLCSLLQKKYTLTTTNLIRIFVVTMGATAMLEIYALDAVGWKGHPPTATQPQTTG